MKTKATNERLSEVKLLFFTQLIILALCVFAAEATGQDKTGTPPLPSPPAPPEAQSNKDDSSMSAG